MKYNSCEVKGKQETFQTYSLSYFWHRGEASLFSNSCKLLEIQKQNFCSEKQFSAVELSLTSERKYIGMTVGTCCWAGLGTVVGAGAGERVTPYEAGWAKETARCPSSCQPRGWLQLSQVTLLIQVWSCRVANFSSAIVQDIYVWGISCGGEWVGCFLLLGKNWKQCNCPKGNDINLWKTHVQKLRKAGSCATSIRPLGCVCSAVCNYMITYHLIHRALPQSVHRMKLLWGQIKGIWQRKLWNQILFLSEFWIKMIISWRFLMLGKIYLDCGVGFFFYYYYYLFKKIIFSNGNVSYQSYLFIIINIHNNFSMI